MTGITWVEAAFAAAARNTDLPGRILVVESRNHVPGSRVRVDLVLDAAAATAETGPILSRG